MNKLLIAVSFLGLFGCNRAEREKNSAAPNSAMIAAADTSNSDTSNWLYSFDIDGDKINDHIDFDFSGGAHCCYKISITLSSDSVEKKFPFEMDGGYIGGVDNSKPEQFDIRDIDNDGLPEILMQIQTYNGTKGVTDSHWRRDFGITSNEIVIEFESGQLIARDKTKNR